MNPVGLGAHVDWERVLVDQDHLRRAVPLGDDVVLRELPLRLLGRAGAGCLLG